MIIDPIASYIDAGLDMGKNNEMRLILQPLIELARDANVAILVDLPPRQEPRPWRDRLGRVRGRLPSRSDRRPRRRGRGRPPHRADEVEHRAHGLRAQAADR